MDASQHIQQTAERVRQAASEQVSFRDLASRAAIDSGTDVRMNVWADDGSTDDSAAVLSAPYAEDVDAAVAAVRRPDRGGALLRPALQTLALGVAQRPEAAGTVVALVADPGMSPQDRLAAIDAAQQMSFNPQAFADLRPDYLQALRGLAEDPNLPVRRRALTILCAWRDEYAQRLLAAGLLGDRKPPLLPAAEAISLIGADTHAQYYPLLRELAQSAPTRTARLQAIRALAGDPAAADMLAGFVTDSGEHIEVRKASMRVLRALTPDHADRLARDIVLSDDEDDRLRAATLSALAFAGESGGQAHDGAVQRKATELQFSSRSSALKRASTAYLDKRGSPR